MGHYADFDAVTAEALDHTLAHFRTHPGDEIVRDLLDAWRTLEPFPELFLRKQPIRRQLNTPFLTDPRRADVVAGALDRNRIRPFLGFSDIRVTDLKMVSEKCP